MSLTIGDTLDGKYKILRLLGEGGMGAVYEGENVRIHRKVAIKILHSTVAQSKDAVQRFEREAQAAGRIGSVHIVEVLDLGELPDGDRYMVMEYLEGESLSDRIEKTGGLSPQKSATILIELLEGLHAAHEAGIIHRDLKPDNVFLLTSKGGQADFVKIVDFGISKFSTLGGEFSMTQTGAVMGTPYYLSPEQAKGERVVDALSDLYAAGVIMWETVAGRVPFDGETFNELLFKIVLEPVPDLTTIKPDLDPHFVSLVHKAMARDRHLRFQSAREMQEAIQGWLQGQPPAANMIQDAQSARITQSRLASSLTANLNKTASGVSTGGNWANTQTPLTPAPSSKKWILIGGIGVAAAAALGMFLSQQKSAEAKAELAAQVEEDKTRQVENLRETELARLGAEKAKAQAERAQAEQARVEAEQQKAEAELSTAQEVRQAAAEQRAAPERTLAQRNVKPRKPAPATSPAQLRPAPVESTPTRPSTRPTPPTSAGRTIRTDL